MAVASGSFLQVRDCVSKWSFRSRRVAMFPRWQREDDVAASAMGALTPSGVAFWMQSK